MQTRTRRVGTLSIASALVLLSSTTALADRRAALNGNQLIEDSEDVFLYPSEALKYNKRLEVEVGGDGNTARALFLGGWDDLVLGMSAQQGSLPGLFTGPNTPDLLARESAAFWGPSQIGGGTANPFGSVGFPAGLASDPTPFSMLDGFLALPVGEMNFGLRATIGLSSNSTTVDGSDAGDSQTLLALTGGLNGGTAGETRWDASLNFTMNMLSIANGGAAAGDASGTALRISGSTRVFIPYNDWLDIGVLGNVALFSRSVSTGDPEFSNSALGFGVLGGAGPVYRLQDGSTLAVYGLLGVATSGTDPNSELDNDATNDFVIFFPAVRAAAEIAVTDWFFARAGLQYSFQNATSSAEGPMDVSSTRRTGQLGWSAGLGVKSDRFQLDGSLQQAWLTQGPDFIGGDSALFGVVSIAYLW